MADQSQDDQQTRQSTSNGVVGQEDQAATSHQILESLRNKLNDPGTDFAQRDQEGQSLLHQAAQAGADSQLLKDLSDRVDLSVRDVQGRTALDLLLEGGDSSAALREVLEGKVKELILAGGEEGEKEARRLLLAGWAQWPLTAEEAKEKSEEAARVLEDLMAVKDKVERVHKAAQDGLKDDLQQLLTAEEASHLLTAADSTGLRPLHKAVLHRQGEVLKFLASTFADDALNIADHMGRTALHFAAAMTLQDAELFQILKDAGADDTIKDLAGKTPGDYQQTPDLLPVADILKRLQGTTTAISSAAEGDGGEDKPEDADTTTTTADNAAETTLQQQTAEEVQTERQSPTQSQNGPRAPSPPKEPSKPAQVTPVTMYLSGRADRDRDRAPPPSTVDGRYVAQHLGSALTMALAEIAEKRPWDPVEYLAQWLYKYRQNVDELEKKKALLEEIRAEEEAANKEEVIKFKRREEQKRIQEEERLRKEEEEAARKKREQEELQRQAKEALLAQKPQLPTVTEEEGEDAGVRDRDEQGQTELHVLAAQSGADLVAVMNLGYSLADRDAQNRTARDVAEEHGLTDNVETIDHYVSNLLEQEKLDTLRQLVVDGYDKLTTALSKVSTEGLPSAVTDFVNSLPELEERVSTVLSAVRSGVAREVENALERKGLALARDQYGRCPLHLALLAGHHHIARTLVDTAPLSLKARDNLNRTPLHYAAALSEEMMNFLNEKGADSNAKDAKQRTPAYYADQKEEILQLQATLPPDTQQGNDGSGSGGGGEDASVTVPQIRADDDDRDGADNAQADDDSQAKAAEGQQAEKSETEPITMGTTSAAAEEQEAPSRE